MFYRSPKNPLLVQQATSISPPIINGSSIVNKNTYYTGTGKSLTHITNSMAGNIESHSTLSSNKPNLGIIAVLDQLNYGFSKLRFHTWHFIKGDGRGLGDELTLIRKSYAVGLATVRAARANWHVKA